MNLIILTLPLLALLGFAVYNWNLQPLYAYMGLLPVELNIEAAVLFVFWAGLAASVMPRRIRGPSDLFLFFYVVICFLWGSLLWPLTGLLTFSQATFMMLLLYTPAFAVRAGSRFLKPVVREYILPISMFQHSQLYIPLLVMLAVGGAAALSSLSHGGLGLDTVYERRLAGRGVLGDNVLAGYAINMAVNGAAPMLAFIAGWRRSPLLLIAAVGFIVIVFWLLGLKSPFINVATLFALGLAMRFPAILRIMVPLGLLLLLSSFAVVALMVSDGGYSMVADYIVRRVTMVQPMIQSYYLNEFLNISGSERLLGAHLRGYSDWTFMIGDRYLNNPAINANTNGFFHALLAGGFAGYLLTVVFVTLLTTVMDALHESTNMSEFIGLAGLYGILVSEQSATAALLSSGIGICFIFTMLASYTPRKQSSMLSKIKMDAGTV